MSGSQGISVRVLYQRQISPRGGHAATSSPSLAAVHVMLDAFRSLVIDSSAETGCSRHVIVGLPRREQHHERLQDRIPNPARPSGVLGRRNSDDGRRSCRQHGNLFRLRPARAASGHDSGSVIARRDLVQQSSAQRPRRRRARYRATRSFGQRCTRSRWSVCRHSTASFSPLQGPAPDQHRRQQHQRTAFLRRHPGERGRANDVHAARGRGVPAADRLRERCIAVAQPIAETSKGDPRSGCRWAPLASGSSASS